MIENTTDNYFVHHIQLACTQRHHASRFIAEVRKKVHAQHVSSAAVSYEATCTDAAGA